MTKTYRRLLCNLSAVILLLSSCQDNSVCDPTTQPLLQVTFSTHYKYPKPGQGYTDSLPCYRVIYKIYALHAAKKDSAIYQDTLRDTVGISRFPAPVSNLDSVSRYVITVNLNKGQLGNIFKTDTLSIAYTKKLKFISQGCGYSYDYTIGGTQQNGYFITLTRNYFIGYKCLSPIIADGKENIRLQFNP